MAKKFVPVQKTLKQMTAPEVKAWLQGLPDSEVMRSILLAEIRAIRAGEERERRTMRGLWYDAVKPLLSRAGILNNKTGGGNDIAWDKKLSVYLAELVRAGETSYEEMRIVDGSRQRQPARSITTQMIDVQMVGDHYPWVILFTEKDTIWPDVQGLADLYGVSAISGSGQPSNACTENTVRAIVRSKSFQRACPESITVLSLTDFDPSGFTIAQAQFDQVLEAARGLGKAELGGLLRVEHNRLGLQPDQLTPEEREANVYQPKDKGLDEWYKQTGGVDGQPLGLELDSLPLSRVRRMFAEGIEKSIDLAPRRQDLRESLIDLLACELLLPGFDAKRRAMIEAIKSSSLWEEINQSPVPGDLFTSLAEDGAEWVSPRQTKALFQSFEERIKRAMREAE